MWVDGGPLQHPDRLCCLVLVGVRADGREELVAVGRRLSGRSEGSWAEVLRDLKRRRMRGRRCWALGGGALGFGV